MVAHLTTDLDLKPPMTVVGPWQLRIKLIKHFVGNNQYVVFKNELIEEKSVCSQKLQDLDQIVLRDSKSVTLVILNQETFDAVLENYICSINEEVYLLNENTGHIFETYTINNIKTKRKVAFLGEDLQIIWTENKNMVKRRSNFHGIFLKSLTLSTGDDVKLNKEFSYKATYFPNNGTYDITEYITGIIIDAFSTIQNTLNFTTKYYMRADRKVGQVMKYSNGTLGGVGIIPDVFLGKADFIAAPLSITLPRMPYLDYLPELNFTYGMKVFNYDVRFIKISIINYLLGCLFMPKQQKTESIDLKLPTNPFTFMVWACVLTTSGMIVISKFVVLDVMQNPIGIFWETFVVHFGGNFEGPHTTRKSYKIIIFTTLFCGNIIWMGYQASLTVDLSVAEPKLPFNSPEGLLNSDWKLYTINKK